MGGTASNKGSQTIQFKYYDPLNSDHFDQHLQDILPVGVYDGGQIEKITDVSVDIHPLSCIISDGTQMVKSTTSVAYTLAVAAGTPWIVASWDYQSLTAWYVDIKAVAEADIGANDLVLGYCNYTMAVLNYIEYFIKPIDSSDEPVGISRFPKSMKQLLRPLPLYTAAMKVFVQGGWINYGSANVDVDGQESALMAAPVAHPRLDLVYIDNAGAVQIETGAEAAVPEPPSHMNKIAIAEIYLTVGQTTILAADIHDVRPWINLGGAGELAGLDLALMLMGA